MTGPLGKVAITADLRPACGHNEPALGCEPCFAVMRNMKRALHEALSGIEQCSLFCGKAADHMREHNEHADHELLEELGCELGAVIVRVVTQASGGKVPMAHPYADRGLDS